MGLGQSLGRLLGGTGTELAAAEKKERISSWMNLYFADVAVHRPESDESLADIVRRGGYSCVGKSHSYNGIQIIRDAGALHFGESALKHMTFDAATNQVTVGPSVTVKELKLFLLEHERRLINSGNYMRQTVIGALMTGTHGYGARPVMAEGIVALTFLDSKGEPVSLARGDPDFPYVALSFGTIAPVVSVTLETEALESYQSDVWIGRLSQKPARAAGALAVSYAVMPYSNFEDPTVMLHTLRHPPLSESTAEPEFRPPFFSLRRLAAFVIERYWAFDKFLPAFRRPMQRLAARLNLQVHQSQMTEAHDLDYLYDPSPKLESERAPNILKSLFSTTTTAYNLAFFVPTPEAPAVVRFIMNEAEELRSLGFYLKSLIGVRELDGPSALIFAGNAMGPVSAIDLFADVRDYAWLERIQRDVLDYFPNVRPHWGKSAVVDDYRRSFDSADLEHLRALHRRHYPAGSLIVCERIRKFLDLSPPSAATNIAKARRAAENAEMAEAVSELAEAVASPAAGAAPAA